MSDDDTLTLSKRRVRQEIDVLRDLLEKTTKTELEYSNIRGQIGVLRRLLRPEGLDSRREFEVKAVPVNKNPTMTEQLY